MPQTSILAVALALLSAGCDEKPQPTAAPETPPAWVAEANERARQQQAKSEAPEPVAEPVVEKFVEHPYLWRVTGDDGVTNHLLGSFDVDSGFSGLEELPDSVRSAFENATTVVWELDQNSRPDEATMTVPSGSGLRERLSKEQMDRLVALIEIPEGPLETFPPFLVAGAINMAWFDKGERAMLERFEILTRAHEKQEEGLDTQNEAFRAVNEAITVDDIATMLEQEQEVRRVRAEAVKTFRSGTATDVTDFLSFAGAEITEREREMIADRNRRWAEKLAPRLQKEGGRLVIVPARHLVGPEGLPALLSKNPSLKTERIDAPPSPSTGE